jgi:hypothetical protein
LEVRVAADTIRRIFFNPSVAIARVGGSLTPLDAFDWGPGDPHTVAETRVLPAWTLDVRTDGSVSPRLPERLALRDGPLLRPLAPFLELWAMTGDGGPADWVPRPVTIALLAANGATTASLTFTIDAMNRKAERRGPRGAGQSPSLLRFGTFPPVRVRGNSHTAVQLLGTSPPEATRPMIPRGRNVPLGRLQVLRPVPQPASPRWPDGVRIDVVRVRFTPARGRFYGPPAAAQVVAGALAPAVPADRAFLDPQAGWFNAPTSNRAVPADTVDVTANDLSLGVVDDTCDARLVAELALAAGQMRCRANISAGPPQYAPDRRPFLSLADEINDREHDRRRDQSLSDEELARWIEDLFERVFETVLAMDVDWWRASAARTLAPDERRPSPIPGDGVPQRERAMGGLDRLRDADIAIPPPSPNQPQPLSQRARDRHRNLSDLKQLVALVRAHPERIEQLVRPTFASPQRDQNGQSMRMPPFMRNSNAQALSLARWQYDLLLRWVAGVTAPGADILAEGDVAPLSTEAEDRRRQILASLDAGGDGP